VTGGDEGAVPEPGLPTPVAPPMTPPVVGGFAAPIASLAGGSAVPDAAELFTEASFVGAPPPTAAPPRLLPKSLRRHGHHPRRLLPHQPLHRRRHPPLRHRLRLELEHPDQQQECGETYI
jgi:hypothetical protein